MSNYTYEAKETDRKLETYEWDNVWWEQADKEKDVWFFLITDCTDGILTMRLSMPRDISFWQRSL